MEELDNILSVIFKLMILIGLLVKFAKSPFGRHLIARSDDFIKKYYNVFVLTGKVIIYLFISVAIVTYTSTVLIVLVKSGSIFLSLTIATFLFWLLVFAFNNMNKHFVT